MSKRLVAIEQRVSVINRRMRGDLLQQRGRTDQRWSRVLWLLKIEMELAKVCLRDAEVVKDWGGTVT